MDKILICLSEGKHALSILRYAKNFANNYGIPYEVIFVRKLNYLEGEIFFVEMPMLYRVSQTEIIDKIDIIDEAGKIIDSGIPFTVLDDSADLIPLLERKYENHEFSLLLLPHSFEMSNWPFMDSISRFINTINCPILLIDPTSVFKEIKHAVYASNYLATDANVLKRFQKISSNRVSKIDIIHISFSESFSEIILEKGFKTYIQEHIPDLNIQVHHIPADRSQHSTVELFINEVSKLNPEILILMKEDKSGWEELFSKSFTLATIKKTTTPILILHEKYTKINTPD